MRRFHPPLFFSLCLAALMACHPALMAGEAAGTIHATDYDALQQAGWQPDARVLRLIRQARLGNPRAMTELGYRHTLGQGVFLSPSAAFDLYTQAARQGNAEAQLFLAAMYEHRENDAQALYWYQQAANRKNPIAMRVMADRYDTGKGVPRDAEKPQTLRREADEADPVLATGMTVEEYDQALESYRRAAKQKIAVARYQLALLYDHYFGPPSENAVAYWYQQAAGQGYAPAQLALGDCYYQGQCGVAYDRAQACTWYEKACQSGSKKACLKLDDARKTP